MTRQFSVIELCCGAGGMALGFDNIGFIHTLLVDKDKDCIATLVKNRPDWNVVHDDINQLNLTPYFGKVDVLSAGLPCQAFSEAGLRKGFEDVRGNIFFSFSNLVQQVYPRIIILENVRGLLTHDKGKTITKISETLSNLNYKVEYQLLNANNFKVPQTRQRVFIIATRQDLNISPSFPNLFFPLVTLREALTNCPESIGASYSEKKKEVLQLIPPGGNWRNLPFEIQTEYMKKSLYSGGGKTGIAKRLHWDKPSPTLTCSPSQNQTERCHPEEIRPLTIREYARIQTFPDKWEFTGSIRSQYRQIGNACPVKLAEVIAIEVKKLLDKSYE
jgi:DNA (cytosine-5)-methyltransferase 1